MSSAAVVIGALRGTTNFMICRHFKLAYGNAQKGFNCTTPGIGVSFRALALAKH